MKLAIVGTSHLSENEELDARKVIVWKIREFKKEIEEAVSLGHIDYLEIITGDANGIDKLVREITKQEGLEPIVKEAKIKSWEGTDGFKARNMEIVKEADYVVSITTNTKKQKCYHCNKDHERTGGCWVLKEIRTKGKEGQVIVI